jgi:hypothetical protein
MNFVDVGSLGEFVSSSAQIGRSVLWGLVDSTPRLGIPHLGGFIVLVFALGVVLGVAQRGRSTLLVAGILTAYIAAVVGVVPLGTGRTDTYLYVPLLLLFGLGLDFAVTRLRRDVLRNVVLGVVAVLPIVGVYDRVVYRQAYPGGDFRTVASIIRTTVDNGGNVIVEGTARWPYTYYSGDSFALTFSPRYNTGFAPVITSPHIVVMRGSEIEGGYDPAAAVNQAYGSPVILTVRADDWHVANPLAPALTGSCYLGARHRHVPGYYLEWWKKGCLPD